MTLRHGGRMMANLAMVVVGGGIGSGLRFLTVGWVMRAFPGFLLGTIAVNVVGSALMGVLAVLLLERLPEGWARAAPFFLTGLMGGFTTFSAFSMDTVFLIERGRLADAAAYVAGSVLLSVGALWLGAALARRLVAP